MKKIQFTDRYEAIGIQYPNSKTMCKGHCEGTGYVPHKKRGIGDLDILPQPDDVIFDKLWEEAHSKPHKEKCDGWHFVKCPDCKGTGKL